MKLKYYLRGMGIGIILTAIVMGFALGGRKATISDAEVIERAKTLGMIDPNSGVLSQTLSGADNYEEENTIASDKELDQKREEISQEIDEIFASASESVSGYAEAPSQGESSEASGTSTEEKVKSDIVDTIIETETPVKTEDNTTEATPGRTPEGLASEKTTTDNKVTSEKTTSDNKSASENESTEDNSADETVTAKTPTEDNVTTENSIPSESQVKTTSGKALTIPKGMSSDSVAELLYQKGFVDSARSFNQYLIDRKMDRIIRSGDKVIPDGASYEEIANIICK